MMDYQVMDSAYLLGNYGQRELTMTRGAGAHVWDDKGNRLLDCTTGIAVNAFGHCYPPVVAAIKNQAEKLIHGSNLYLLGPQQELARLLVENTYHNKAFFCNSGTEAIEAAIKFARKYRKAGGEKNRITILSLENSFHGRTYGSLAATGQAKLKADFGPMPDGFKSIPVNNADALEKAVTDTTAAVIFEPILAEGGIISLDQNTAAALNRLQEKGITLIADEIQAGLGRTGSFLACESLGLRPEITALAKPLGGGLPLGAVLLNQPIADAISPGDHASTFGGNPVACAAGIQIVETLLQPGFFEDLKDRSQYFRDSLKTLIKSRPGSGLNLPLLGRGFLIGARFEGNLNELLRCCRKRGLLVHRAATDVLRLLPPLNISREEMDEAIEKLSGALSDLQQG
jgi:predicted acetylornithine/succinylornithine family transaminase